MTTEARREPTGETCPHCGNDKLVFRVGGHPKFAAVRTCTCCGKLHVATDTPSEPPAGEDIGAALTAIKADCGWAHDVLEAEIGRLTAKAESAEKALTHVADEIRAQRTGSSDRYWDSHATRVYWAQVEGVARDALRWSAALATPAPASADAAPHHNED